MEDQFEESPRPKVGNAYRDENEGEEGDGNMYQDDQEDYDPEHDATIDIAEKVLLRIAQALQETGFVSMRQLLDQVIEEAEVES